jgi:glutamate/tyrosine decarboxylase-like PLP-dependent enzyme
LNVPYDSGLVFVRHGAALRAAMAQSAAYYIAGEQREPMHYTPETSRRARGVEVWAVLRSLGRQGLADLIERTCQLATRFADGLQAAGYEVLNDVQLNQVLVSFGTDAQTRSVIAAVQRDGTCWCGGTRWHGRDAMRISVSNWATTAEDVDRSLAAMVRIASTRSIDQAERDAALRGGVLDVGDRGRLVAGDASTMTDASSPSFRADFEEGRSRSVGRGRAGLRKYARPVWTGDDILMCADGV